MEICTELRYLSDTVVGLGFFDGVHIAHRELISQLVNKAKEYNLQSVLLTFQKSPAEKFIEDVQYITTNSEKESIIEKLGVDYLFELEFSEDLSNMSAETYLKDIVVEYFKPKCIFTGFNHTFGQNRHGNPKFLEKMSSIYGYEYVQIPAIKLGKETVSSSYIRKLLNNGDIEKAKSFLNYDYSFSGIVQSGNKIGSKMGFPTANIFYPDEKVNLPYGAYCVSVEVGGVYYKGVMNYGIKPTIKSSPYPIMEVHILDFNKDIYNKCICVTLLKWLRKEKKFSSQEELMVQIKKDIKECLK